MRLRTFTARSPSEAMSLVRRELGPEAVILSTDTAPGGGTTIVAALDAAAPEPVLAPSDGLEIIHAALDSHAVPQLLLERLLGAALDLTAEPPALALAGALDVVLSFAPIEDAARIALVGPPGAGKTSSAAKLAARAVLAGRTARLVTTDTVRAGGIEQLAAFARILDVPIEAAAESAALGTVVASAGEDELVIIDTAGINPYRAADRAELATLLAASDAEPVLVLPGGGDLVDAVEMADAFRELGCRRFIATRLDMVHRLGSLLAVAEGSRLAFSEAGIGPGIADDLVALNPVALARLLLPEDADAPIDLLSETALP